LDILVEHFDIRNVWCSTVIPWKSKGLLIIYNNIYLKYRNIDKKKFYYKKNFFIIKKRNIDRKKIYKIYIIYILTPLFFFIKLIYKKNIKYIN